MTRDTAMCQGPLLIMKRADDVGDGLYLCLFARWSYLLRMGGREGTAPHHPASQLSKPADPGTYLLRPHISFRPQPSTMPKSAVS